MIENLPEQAYGLGTPSSDFRVDRARFLRSAIFLLLIFAFFGLLDYWLDARGILLMFGLVPLALAAYRLLKLFYNQDLRVLIFAEALVHTKAKTTKVVRWDDVAFLWEKFEQVSINFTPVYTTHQYKIETCRGEKLVLGRTLKQIDLLGLALKNKIGERLVPRIVQSLKAGQTERFGVLSLNNQGITCKGKLLTWDEVKGIKLVQGRIHINTIRRSWPPFANVDY